MAGEAAPTARLEARLGHRFRDSSLLERALTHSSLAHETGQGKDYEELEFLGDALLGFLIAEALFRRYPGMDEGGLSKCKAYLVRKDSLAAIAREIDLGPHLRLGKAVDKAQSRVSGSVLADVLEAVLAAVHLDAGDEAARGLVERLFGSRMTGLDRDAIEQKDYKTALQEALQAAGSPPPRYRVGATEGPPHRPTFHVDLLVDGRVVARGRGFSKKDAEQKAARLALRLIRRTGETAKRA
jgi:ribonuclease-3